MTGTPSRRSRAWRERAVVWWPLFVAVAGLALGGVLHLLGQGSGGNAAWSVVAVVGAVLSLISIVEGIAHRRMGVDVIALLALVGATLVREYLAAAIISVMLATGRALEGWAEGRAGRELEALLARAPKTAHRYRDGGLETIPLETVVPGDLLMVAAGEVVPVDGMVVSSSAELDESALTGEPLPVERGEGDLVRSGVVNAGGPFDFRATTDAADSTYAGIVRLVADAQSAQVPFVRLADQYALGFLVITLAAAGAAWAVGGATRAVAVLVVATPCPLILAAPVAFVAGLSRAARRGIIVKGGGVLERLAKGTTLLLDKTGTVTLGRPTLLEVVTAGEVSAHDVLGLAASLDQMSPHVIARSVVRAAVDRGIALILPSEVDELAGSGIRGVVSGRAVVVGNAAWTGVAGAPAWARSARRQARLEGALTVFVSIDGVPAGVMVFEDPLRADAARTIRSLRSGGIKRVVLVTGDRLEVAETIGAVVGVDEVLAERTPQEKLDVVTVEVQSASTIMVGDGINDAPALALADVGVAMGARGATATSEAADVVLTVDRLDRLGEAIAIARRTRRVATQSMVAGMALSLIAMGVALGGRLSAVWGALLQEVIDAAAIFSALRALRSGTSEVRMNIADSALSRRFSDEHHFVRDVIRQLKTLADTLDALERAELLVRARAVHRRLVVEVLPHEQAEEKVLYPALGRIFGGHDPMGSMSRAHVEIAHRVRRLGQLIDDIDENEMDDIDLVDLRSVLYGLQAILSLHTAQEEENYMSLAEEVGVAPATT